MWQVKTDGSERLQSQNGGNIFTPMTGKRGQRLGLGSNPPWEKWREHNWEKVMIFSLFFDAKSDAFRNLFPWQ